MSDGTHDLRLVAKQGPEESMTIREFQNETEVIRREKGFSADPKDNFIFIAEEVAEASKAWRMGLPDRGEELADVAIYTARLAEITGVDLEAEVRAKLKKVRTRHYERLPGGAMRKVEREAGG
jgi:NTP pyrophosphatase (non-canonical NTP hydrolase)